VSASDSLVADPSTVTENWTCGYQKVRAQAEHCRGRGEMAAELTPVAVSRF